MTFGVLREALRSARSQPVASTLTILMVVGMIFVVMLTTGRTVGAEQRVLGSIDSAGTRTILIRAEVDAGLDSTVLDRIEKISGIEWAAGFSSAVDATNSQVLDGTRVPIRYAYGSQFERLGIPEARVASAEEVAWASPEAIKQLGFTEASGGITLASGGSLGLVGQLIVPSFLDTFEPLVLVPRSRESADDSLGVVLVIAETPEQVLPVAAAVRSVLAVDDPSKISVQTSEALANLRALIESQLGTFSRGLVLALLGLTGMLVAVIQYGLVMMRRKDFGRRRALGASRGLIILLQLVQASILTVVGIGAGTAAATVALIASGDPAPGLEFTAALAVLAFATSLLAAVLPAVAASRRDPIRELRVP